VTGDEEGRPIARPLPAPPMLRERCRRSLAGLLVVVRRAAYLAVVTARLHPGAILWCGRRYEDAPDDGAVFKHAVIFEVRADRPAFEDQVGHRRGAAAAGGHFRVRRRLAGALDGLRFRRLGRPPDGPSIRGEQQG
jgi:hypothetical protein